MLAYVNFYFEKVEFFHFSPVTRLCLCYASVQAHNTLRLRKNIMPTCFGRKDHTDRDGQGCWEKASPGPLFVFQVIIPFLAGSRIALNKFLLQDALSNVNLAKWDLLKARSYKICKWQQYAISQLACYLNLSLGHQLYLHGYNSNVINVFQQNKYLVMALGSQLVDLRLSNVSAVLNLLQLMLNLPEPRHVSVGLLLL